MFQELDKKNKRAGRRSNVAGFPNVLDLLDEKDCSYLYSYSNIYKIAKTNNDNT